MGQAWTKELFSKKIEQLFPEWKHEILEYAGYKKPLIIKCMHCGQIMNFSQASRIFSRVNACKCFKGFKSYKDKVVFLGTLFNFEVLNYDSMRSSQVETKCLKCGTIQTRLSVGIFLTPNHCPGCSNHECTTLIISKEEAQNRLNQARNNEFKIIEYNGITKPALLQHKCGFIYKATNLIEIINSHTKGCPKCYKNKSKGEIAIELFLEQNNIDYISQKTFQPISGKAYYRFDFYIPKYNLAIEYQGEQHYRDNGFAREGLEKIQYRDQIKRDYCKKNNIELLEISYRDILKIPMILKLRFNDYGESQQG